jgi:glutamine amidotransferase
MKIAIINYEMGNLHSVVRKIQLQYEHPIITSDAEVILSADKIILPGVGHFGKAMEQLQKLNLIAVLNQAVLKEKKTVLGICLGMQLMADFSEEGNVKGLGWISGTVRKINVENSKEFKIPHIGWNQVMVQKESKLMQGIKNNDEFYFVHAYQYQCENPKDILTTTKYENNLVSAIEKSNIFGVQFHPEKSHKAGMQLLHNFLTL